MNFQKNKISTISKIENEPRETCEADTRNTNNNESNKISNDKNKKNISILYIPTPRMNFSNNEKIKDLRNHYHDLNDNNKNLSLVRDELVKKLYEMNRQIVLDRKILQEKIKKQRIPETHRCIKKLEKNTIHELMKTCKKVFKKQKKEYEKKIVKQTEYYEDLKENIKYYNMRLEKFQKPQKSQMVSGWLFEYKEIIQMQQPQIIVKYATAIIVKKEYIEAKELQLAVYKKGNEGYKWARKIIDGRCEKMAYLGGWALPKGYMDKKIFDALMSDFFPKDITNHIWGFAGMDRIHSNVERIKRPLVCEVSDGNYDDMTLEEFEEYHYGLTYCWECNERHTHCYCDEIEEEEEEDTEEEEFVYNAEEEAPIECNAMIEIKEETGTDEVQMLNMLKQINVDVRGIITKYEDEMTPIVKQLIFEDKVRKGRIKRDLVERRHRLAMEACGDFEFKHFTVKKEIFDENKDGHYYHKNAWDGRITTLQHTPKLLKCGCGSEFRITEIMFSDYEGRLKNHNKSKKHQKWLTDVQLPKEKAYKHKSIRKHKYKPIFDKVLEELKKEKKEHIKSKKEIFEELDDEYNNLDPNDDKAEKKWKCGVKSKIGIPMWKEFKKYYVNQFEKQVVINKKNEIKDTIKCIPNEIKNIIDNYTNMMSVEIRNENKYARDPNEKFVNTIMGEKHFFLNDDLNSYRNRASVRRQYVNNGNIVSIMFKKIDDDMKDKVFFKKDRFCLENEYILNDKYGFNFLTFDLKNTQLRGDIYGRKQFNLDFKDKKLRKELKTIISDLLKDIKERYKIRKANNDSYHKHLQDQEDMEESYNEARVIEKIERADAIFEVGDYVYDFEYILMDNVIRKPIFHDSDFNEVIHREEQIPDIKEIIRQVDEKYDDEEYKKEFFGSVYDDHKYIKNTDKPNTLVYLDNIKVPVLESMIKQLFPNKQMTLKFKVIYSYNKGGSMKKFYIKVVNLQYSGIYDSFISNEPIVKQPKKEVETEEKKPKKEVKTEEKFENHDYGHLYNRTINEVPYKSNNPEYKNICVEYMADLIMKCFKYDFIKAYNIALKQQYRFCKEHKRLTKLKQTPKPKPKKKVKPKSKKKVKPQQKRSEPQKEFSTKHINFSILSRKDLRTICIKFGIKKYRNVKKDGLIVMIKNTIDCQEMNDKIKAYCNERCFYMVFIEPIVDSDNEN